MGWPIDERPQSRWRGFELAHDLVDEPPIPNDVVVGASPTTELLASITHRPRCRRALDLATGCGALALLAARHADHVVATDVNPRALEYTAVNARRADLAHVEVRLGDLFDPVGGERFDLVTGNLPFVLSPTPELLFRDGTEREPGSVGIVERAVNGVGRVLAPGGVAYFLANWPVIDGKRPEETAVGWLRASGRGGLVLLKSVDDPYAYAKRWTAGMVPGAASSPGRRAVIESWVEHLRAMGASGVANGAIVVHEVADRSVRFVRADMGAAGDGGGQVWRMLTAAVLDDASLLAARPRLVTPWTARLSRRHDGESTASSPAWIALDDTCGVVGRVPVHLLPVIERLDGAITVRGAAGVMARRSPADREELLDVVRHLVAVGVLELR